MSTKMMIRLSSRTCARHLETAKAVVLSIKTAQKSVVNNTALKSLCQEYDIA